MRFLVLGALLAMTAAPALAAQAPSTATAGQDAAARTADAPKAAKVLYVCDKSDATRRAFAREFGSAEFVDAKAALDADAWSAPRCITPAEAKRLKRMKLATR